MSNSFKKKDWIWAYGFVAPTILGLLILNIIPIFQTFYLSFHKSGAFGKGDKFIGLKNYAKLLADPQVWQATWNTLRYMLLVVPLTIVISLILAVILNSKIKGRNFYRSVYFLPMVAAPAAITMVWKWLYNTQFGLINHVLGYFGVGPIAWIDDPQFAMYSVAIIGIWGSIGYNMILLLAGLQEIPKDYYEAATMDGATPIKKLFSITLPLLSPQIFFVLVTSIISSLQVFDTIYMMILNTSPAYDSTVSLVYLFYNNTFKYSDKGYGSTIVILLLAIIMLITVIQVRLQKKWVNYMEG